jgi:Xaa-Pro aminopeptidase
VRIERACGIAKSLKVEGLIIEDLSDIFYLTGGSFSAGRLLVKPDGATLFVDGRYYNQAKGNVPCDVILEEKGALEKALRGMKKIGFDSTSMTVDQLNRLEKSATGVHWVPTAKPLKELRVCKDEREVALLRRAAQVTADGYQFALKKLRDGVEEREIALDFEMQARRVGGASGVSFAPTIAFGESSAFPHHKAGRAQLRKNQIALFDLGATVDHYQGDMTRVFFYGQPQAELKQFYNWVKEAHDMAAAAIRPGVRLGELDRIVRAFFAERGVEALFCHSLGHGVGIDVHEYPRIRHDGEDADVTARAGMIFTIEPGLYLPGIGGVRYENTLLVTESGSENFYAGV